MDLPTAKERFEIFRQCLKGHDISGLDLKALANADSIDFSGELSFKSRNVIPSTFFEKLHFPLIFNRTFYMKFKKLNCSLRADYNRNNVFQRLVQYLVLWLRHWNKKRMLHFLFSTLLIQVTG